MSQSGVYGAGGGGGTPITRLAGDFFTASGSTVNVITGYVAGSSLNGTAQFRGDNVSTLTLQFEDGGDNVALGFRAFTAGGPGVSSSQNIAIGSQSGTAINGAAQGNTLVGYASGDSLLTGSFNICVGWASGNNLVSSESNNIYLNTPGVTAESNTLRIGAGTGSSTQDLAAAFICGIQGVDVGSVASVVSISGDQLGSTTITAGAGITVTPGANTITIANSEGLSWVDVPGSSQAMVPNTGYVADDTVLVTLTLPVAAAFGTRLSVVGNGTGGWEIAQNAGQSIRFGSAGSTTVGVGGSLTSTNQFDTIQLLCVVANTTWNVIGATGNITIV